MLRKYLRTSLQSTSPAALSNCKASAVYLGRIQLPLALLLLFLLQATFFGNASAHSGLVESQPANGALLEHAPERVVATFSEELDSSLSSMSVFDAQGAQVDNGDGGVDLNDLEHKSMIVSLPPLPAGTYTVHWNALSSEDGDESAGDFTFTVSIGDADSAPAVRPAERSDGLIAGAVTAGLIILVAAAVIVWRRRSAPVGR
jgi:methionine-rich copper-binding protein CopC